MAKHSIGQVVEKGLCTGCGTCVSICPKKAVSLFIAKKSQVYLAKVGESCVNCGLCLKVCPGYTVDFAHLNKQFLGKDLPLDCLGILLGNYLNCYTGFASDRRVRYDSSSGGLVTQLLIFALDEGIIDGALVTRMSDDNPLEPQPFIARTKQDLVKASKSKYCPVPANIALREILEKDGKYAVVGLPCQLHGIRKAELINEALRNRIVLHFGVFCSHTDNFAQVEFLFNRWRIKPANVTQIDFRGKGWPGFSSVALNSKVVKNYSYQEWTAIHESCFFMPHRCSVCCDQTAELADISFGDAWLPEFMIDSCGRSVLISRTDIGERLIRNANLKGAIELTNISALKVAKSQGMMRFKKNSFEAKLFFSKILGKNIPLYTEKRVKSTLVDYLRSLLIFANQKLASRRRLWWICAFLVCLNKQLKKVYSLILHI